MDFSSEMQGFKPLTSAKSHSTTAYLHNTSFEKALLSYYCTICISCKATKLGDLFRLSFWTSTDRNVLSFGSSHSQRGQYLTSVEFLRGFFPPKIGTSSVLPEAVS